MLIIKKFLNQTSPDKLLWSFFILSPAQESIHVIVQPNPVNSEGYADVNKNTGGLRGMKLFV
jgi:hypothetical protein